MTENNLPNGTDWKGPERRTVDRRKRDDRRAKHGLALRMIHELAQRFEQLSDEGRQKVVEYAKMLLVEEMTSDEKQLDESSPD